MIKIDVWDRDVAVLAIHYAVVELERFGSQDDERIAQRHIALEAADVFAKLGKTTDTLGKIVHGAVNRLCNNTSLPQSERWNVAKRHLRRVAQGAKDGVLPECVLTPVIREVTDHVRAAYAEQVTINKSDKFECKMRMEPAKSREKDPMGIGAETSISGHTRRVRVFLTMSELTPTHMCVLAYVLFHELVCHGFQQIAAESGASVAGSTAWSEGWMDGVAWRMAERWVVEEGESVLGFAVTEEALSAMRAAHEARFVGKNIEKRGRQSFSRMRTILADGDTQPKREAAGLYAERFSIAVNGNPSANGESVDQLGAWATLMGASDLNGTQRQRLRGAVETFFENRDLEQLLDNFQPFLSSLR